MTTHTNTLFIGKVLHQLDAIGSTNQYALDVLSKSKPSEGIIFLTHNQYAGRGQVNKHWESEPRKNLTFSLLLYPTFLPARQQFLLSQAISLGIAETLQTFIPKKISIKWPNDLYVEDRKITGILIQNSLKGSSLQSAVVGIGLNVNQAIFKSDAPNPTSIFLETNQTLDLNLVLDKLCQHIEQRYLQLKAGHHQQLQKDYRQFLFRLNAPHLYKRPDNAVFSGTIKGVTEIGQLQMETERGMEVFSLKEVAYVL